MGLIAWAERTAGMLLADVGTRWAHVRCAGMQAAAVAAAVPPQDRELLVASALVHDIGYAPALSHTGFHPLDGARWLRSQGAPERMACLVAHHTAAAIEADRRGLTSELQAFEQEESATADALWYADLTSGPDGSTITFQRRAGEILDRYEPGSIVHDSISEALPLLRGAVERTQGRLGSQPRWGVPLGSRA